MAKVPCSPFHLTGGACLKKMVLAIGVDLRRLRTPIGLVHKQQNTALRGGMKKFLCHSPTIAVGSSVSGKDSLHEPPHNATLYIFAASHVRNYDRVC